MKCANECCWLLEVCAEMWNQMRRRRSACWFSDHVHLSVQKIENKFILCVCCVCVLRSGLLVVRSVSQASSQGTRYGSTSQVHGKYNKARKRKRSEDRPIISNYCTCW